MAFMRRAKFGLAFENESYPGYCTEKLLQARAAGCVPIYWGDPEVTMDFNKDAFLEVGCTGDHMTRVIAHTIRAFKGRDHKYYTLQQPFFQPGAEERVNATFNNWISRMAAMVK